MSRLALLVVLVLAAGCEADPGLRIALDSRGGLGADLAELRVELLANQSDDPSEPYTCAAASQTFPGAGGGTLELPVVVVVRPGELPWRSVAIVAEAWSASAPLFRTEAVFVTDLSEVEERTLWLDGACMTAPDTPLCEPDEVCVPDGAAVECASSEVAPLLDDPLLSASCDSEP